ncbi:MAG TPA: transcription elongation factor GreA [Candidatus Limnocylindrales bacterium]|nr:transcription elongation factor GreA [Candidatus Limnocylindrales bacterium]
MPRPLSAATLLRDVGLLPDGPLPWGRPVPARGAGVFVVELPAPLPTAPIELTRVGKWLERVPALTLDGVHPSSRALSARLAAFWLPSEVVLYVGATTSSIGARVRAMTDTTLGDRRPHAGGHWLHTLRVLPTTRLWWAATDAVEEYEDALLAAFADSVEPSQTGPQAAIARDVAAPGAVILPFANLRRPTGERRATGLIGALRPEPVEPVPPPTRVVVVPDGDADGARGEPPPPRRRSAPPRSRPGGAPISLTAEGAQRLRDELAELSGARRTEVVGRIRAAKELGDLKENADYTAAREEQSFLEGRIQAIEARLREAVIAPEPSAGGPGGAQFGSTITVDNDGQETVYRLVGSAEADPGAGRLSIESPVGRALLGAVPGATVRVQTPRGPVDYRVIALD